MTTEELFWAKVNKTEDCWVWTAGRDWDGYGQFHIKHQLILAHRYAYELLVGPIPEGLTIDHLCRNEGCVNPVHLEAVTIGVNVLRGNGPCAQNARKTRCMHGHPFDLFNTGYESDGHRWCRACKRERDTRRQVVRR